MPRTCKEDNCNNSVFGGNYCKYHQFCRRMSGGDKHTPKTAKNVPLQPQSPKSGTMIPKESKTRKKESKTYKEVKDEIRAELIATAEWNCFFCTKPMGEEKGFHHTHKRDGSYFTDRKYLKPAHNDCHVWHYHQAKIKDLLLEPWYQGFLNRLKQLDPKLYEKELNKQSKNINIFQDEDE